MNAGAKTAPSGTQVPAAIRSASEPGDLARASIQKAIDCANALHQLDEENATLRETVRRQADEIEGLKRHIISMGRAE